MAVFSQRRYVLLALCGLLLCALIWITATAAVFESNQAQSRIVAEILFPGHDGAPIIGRDTTVCKTYVTEAPDTCKTITKAHDITMAQLQMYNSYTWRFDCQNMPQGSMICIGPGLPPMPTARLNATCGPLVPGTTRPTNWSDLASLNPCPSTECVSLSYSSTFASL